MKNQEVDWLLREKYKGEKTCGFFADCERLAVGEPLGYIIGHTPFLDCTIWLDSHPLIPRPETEYWVEKAITEISLITAGKALPASFEAESLGRERKMASPVLSGHSVKKSSSLLRTKILDLCAGSGAIGIAVAKALPHAAVIFGELDPVHIETINKNIFANLGKISNTQVYVSDLFSHIDGTFDFILTNPPYIDKEANTVEESVERHEPHLALFGGKDGLEIIEKIIIESKTRLKPQGQLWIEHEPFQAESITKIAQENGYTTASQKDQYDTIRYSVLTLAMAQ